MGRNEQTRKRRAEVIEAALKCFQELGYAKTTMADIRRHSSASTGSIYHHFRSKQQLATAVYFEGVKNYQEGLLRVLAAEKQARKGIRSIVGYHLQWVSDHPTWARYLTEMRHAEFMDGAESRFKELNAHFAAGITTWVSGHMKAGRLKPVSRDVFIALLLGPCQEYARQWLAGHAVLEPTAAAAAMAEPIWRSLQGNQREENHD
ncbi:MAG: TetR/AcrR family transcriptional regulator [Thermodesulfobacteriota bacterium]